MRFVIVRLGSEAPFGRLVIRSAHAERDRSGRGPVIAHVPDALVVLLEFGEILVVRVCVLVVIRYVDRAGDPYRFSVLFTVPHDLEGDVQLVGPGLVCVVDLVNVVLFVHLPEGFHVLQGPGKRDVPLDVHPVAGIELAPAQVLCGGADCLLIAGCSCPIDVEDVGAVLEGVGRGLHTVDFVRFRGYVGVGVPLRLGTLRPAAVYAIGRAFVHLHLEEVHDPYSFLHPFADEI